MASTLLLTSEGFPSLQIRNIRTNTNPRLDNCSSGFDKNIVTFGFKLSHKQEGFFIIFVNNSTRKSYLHNSKWLKDLKRIHLTPGLDCIDVNLIDYTISHGLIVPFLNLVVIPKDFYYNQDFVSQEEILLEYIRSTSKSDWMTALNLCHNMFDLVPYSCTNNVNAVCNGHIGNVILLQKLGKESGNLERNILLCNLAFKNINLCRSMRSKVVLADLLLHFPCISPSEEKRKRLQASQIVLDMCSSSFEKLLTGKSNNKKEFLANHTFNMACICYEMAEYKTGAEHIENIRILTDAESRKTSPNKHMMRIREANALLFNLIIDYVDNPFNLKFKESLVQVTNDFVETKNQQPPTFQNKSVLMIGEITQVTSDIEMKIEVYGRGVFDIDISVMKVFDINGDLLKSLTDVESEKHCATISFDQDLTVEQVFIKEKDQFETESVVSETEHMTKVNKVVTFNPKDDIFGESDEDLDCIEDDMYPNILSAPVSSEIVTTGVSEIDNILNDMEEYILVKLEEKYKSEPITKSRMLANTMADSWRKNETWLEEFWDTSICNSYDQTKGRFVQPRDVSIDQIREELTKNYNYNPSFNKRLFINLCAEFLSQASINYLKEKQKEREKVKDSDDDLTKSFKYFWVKEENNTDFSYDDIQDILNKNHVTIKYLKQGYVCSASKFDQYLKENLCKLEEHELIFIILIFKTFFELEKENKFIQHPSLPLKVNNLNDSIVDIEDDDDDVDDDEEEGFFTEIESRVHPYLTKLLEDITNNLKESEIIGEEMYYSNIKDFLSRGLNLKEELKGTKLVNDLSHVLKTLQITLSKYSEVEEEIQKTTKLTSFPKKHLEGLTEVCQEMPACADTDTCETIKTETRDSNKVLSNMYKLHDEMSEMIEHNVLVDIKEYDRKVKTLGAELKKTPQGTGVHFGVNFKQLHNKLIELNTKQRELSSGQTQSEPKEIINLETGMQQLDLSPNINEIQQLKSEVIRLEQEIEQYKSNHEGCKSELMDQTLSVSCLKTENFTLKLKEKDLQDTVHYLRKNQDSALLKALEKKSDLESKNVKLTSENDSLKKKMEEMESKMKEMEKDQILLEYKLEKAQPTPIPDEDIQNKKPIVNQDMDPNKPRIKLIIPNTGKFLFFNPDLKLGLPSLLVKKYHPETTAIKYKLAGGHWRMLILENDHFHPPEDGWGDREYEIVNQAKKPSTTTLPTDETRITPPRLPQIYPQQTELLQTPAHSFIPSSRPMRPLMPHNPINNPYSFSFNTNPRHNPNIPPYFGYGPYFK